MVAYLEEEREGKAFLKCIIGKEIVEELWARWLGEIVAYAGVEWSW